jgi:hypothetical protein
MNILHEETCLDSSLDLQLRSTRHLNSHTSSNQPEHTIKPPKLRRTENARKQSTWQDMELQLALYLSLSSLTDDKEIARFMDDTSTPIPLTTTITDTTAIKPTSEETIQHPDLFRNSTPDTDTNADITPSDTDLKPVDDITLSLSIPTSPYEPAPAPLAQSHHAPRDSHPLCDSTDSLSSTLSLADEWTLLYTNINTDTDTNTDTRPHAQHQLDTNINNHTEAGPHSDNQTQLQTQTPLPLSPFSETETWILVE